MSRDDMTNTEASFNLFSQALDSVPEEKRLKLLAKIAMVLSDRLGDPEATREAVAIARKNL